MAQSKKRDKFNEKQHDILSKIDEYFRTFGDAITRGNEYRSFGYGFQWTNDQRVELQKLDMNPLTQNAFAKHLNRIFGEFYGNPLSFNLNANISMANADQIEAMQLILEKGLKKSNNGNKFGLSFEGSARTGLASGIYAYSRYRDDSSFQQDFFLSYIDFNSLFFDPLATLQNKSDGNYIGYIKSIDKATYESRFNKKYQVGRSIDPRYSSYNKMTVADRDETYIYHFFEKDYKKVTLYLTSTGRRIDNEEDLEEGEQIIDKRQTVLTTIKYYIGDNEEILEEGVVMEGKLSRLPISVTDGNHVIVDGELYPQPIGYDLYDEQRLLNVIVAQLDSVLRNMRKENIWIDKKHLVNNPVLQMQAQNPLKGSSAWATDSNIGPPPQVFGGSPNVMPLFEFYEGISKTIDNALGMYDAVQGAPSNEISGIAQSFRIGQNNLGVYYYINTVIECAKGIGEILLEMIPAIYVEEREIIGKNRTLFLNSPNQLGDSESLSATFDEFDKSHLDINIAVSASFQVERQQQMMLLLNLLKISPEDKNLFIPFLLELSQLPESPRLLQDLMKKTAITDPMTYKILKGTSIDELEEMAKNQQQQAGQAQQEVQQMAMATAKSRLQETQSKIQQNTSRSQLDRGQLELNAQKERTNLLGQMSNYQLGSDKSDREEEAHQDDMTAAQIKADAEVKKAVIDMMSALVNKR